MAEENICSVKRSGGGELMSRCMRTGCLKEKHV